MRRSYQIKTRTALALISGVATIATFASVMAYSLGEHRGVSTSKPRSVLGLHIGPKVSGGSGAAPATSASNDSARPSDGSQTSGNGDAGSCTANGAKARCSKSFTLGGNVSGLYPGATLPLSITVSNPNNRAITVTSITVNVLGADTPGCAPSTSNLSPSNYTGPGFVVERKASRTVDLSVTMPKTVADACQHATFTLNYTATASQA